MNGQVTSIKYESTEMDLIDFVCIQIDFSFIFSEERVYF